MSSRSSRRVITTLLLVAFAALVLAACGGSDDNSSSDGGGSAAAAPEGPPGPAIKLGMICSCSGPQAGTLALVDRAAKSWANNVNENGGINGHAVELTVLDDGGNPAQSLQYAKQLVEHDGVMAIVGEYSLADSTWADYVASKDVPVVGGISPSAPFLTNPDFFPSGGNLIGEVAGALELAKADGKTHVGGLYCAESPICAEFVPLVQGAASALGMDATTEKVSSTAPDYVAQCLRLKGDGVDAMFVGAGSEVVQGVTDDCAQQSFTPLTANTTATATKSWLSNDNLDGAVLTGYAANAFDSSTPAIQEFRDAVDKYYPGTTDDDQFSANMIGPWAGGKLFEAAAKAANIGPDSTGADVKKGLYALKEETLGGLSMPLTFTPGQPTFSPCYFTVELKDGEFASTNGNQPSCLADSLVAAVLPK
jgi:branched-chain amino acid transport system substrate-binding protein